MALSSPGSVARLGLPTGGGPGRTRATSPGRPWHAATGHVAPWSAVCHRGLRGHSLAASACPGRGLHKAEQAAALAARFSETVHRSRKRDPSGRTPSLRPPPPSLPNCSVPQPLASQAQEEAVRMKERKPSSQLAGTPSVVLGFDPFGPGRPPLTPSLPQGSCLPEGGGRFLSSSHPAWMFLGRDGCAGPTKGNTGQRGPESRPALRCAESSVRQTRQWRGRRVAGF